MSGDTFEFDDKARVERLVGTLHDPAATTGDVLTVQADKSIAAAPGGGSGGVQTITVPVSSAQILDLVNTPVVLVPGTPGNVTVVNGGSIAYLAGLVPYRDGGGGITVTTGAGLLNWLLIAATAGFWDQPTSQILVQGYGNGNATGASSAWDGQDILLSSSVDPTLGDGTLLVTLSYFLAPAV